jgi:RimJ/RimL family protein N-acetyltransferase
MRDNNELLYTYQSKLLQESDQTAIFILLTEYINIIKSSSFQSSLNDEDDMIEFDTELYYWMLSHYKSWNLNLSFTFHSRRLVLRKFIYDDYQKVFENWANDPEVTRYLRYSPHKTTLDSLSYMHYRESSYFKDFLNLSWIVINKEDSEPIGEISVVGLNQSEMICEIGYNFGKKYWNKGYATEALKIIIPYLREYGFTKLTSSVLKPNIASSKVLLKNGFEYSGETTSNQLDQLTGEKCNLYNYFLVL